MEYFGQSEGTRDLNLQADRYERPRLSEKFN